MCTACMHSCLGRITSRCFEWCLYAVDTKSRSVSEERDDSIVSILLSAVMMGVFASSNPSVCGVSEMNCVLINAF